jgi:hypothetical protein
MLNLAASPSSSLCHNFTAERKTPGERKEAVEDPFQAACQAARIDQVAFVRKIKSSIISITGSGWLSRAPDSSIAICPI